MHKITSAKELDTLEISSVILLVAKYDGAFTTSFELYDETTTLLDENGDRATEAWVSSTYSAEYSSKMLFDRFEADIYLLFDGGSSVEEVLAIRNSELYDAWRDGAYHVWNQNGGPTSSTDGNPFTRTNL